jgi:hypothetical protein
MSKVFDVVVYASELPNEAANGVTYYVSTQLKNNLPARVFNYILRKYFRATQFQNILFNSAKLRIRSAIRTHKPDVVIIHDPVFLSNVAQLKSSCNFKLVFNAHEYYPLEFDNRPNWAETYQKYYEELYSTYLPQVDLLVNVSATIVEKTKEVFGRDSFLLPNAAFYHDLQPKPCGSIIKVVHHGACIKDRYLERMIEAVGALPERFALDMYLTKGSNVEYYNQIQNLCERYSNVKLLQPISFADIVPMLNNYDVGLYLLFAENFNQMAAMPNKIFEYIQARLALVISPNVDMAKLVNQWQCGVVSKGFDVVDCIHTLRELSAEKILHYKMNSSKAAQVLSSEEFHKQYLEQIRRLVH